MVDDLRICWRKGKYGIETRRSLRRRDLMSARRRDQRVSVVGMQVLLTCGAGHESGKACGMSNTIVRIALVNMLLAGIFVAVITLQFGSVVPAVMVLGALALLINAVFLMSNKSTPTRATAP